MPAEHTSPPDGLPDPSDRDAVIAGYRRNCAELEAGLAAATPEWLQRRSAGTRWNNEELLFDVANYWGSRAGARVYNRRRMAAKLRRLTSRLVRGLAKETPADLGRAMSFPARWDPFFRATMSLADVCAYPTEHFDFHAGQLSADGPVRQHFTPRRAPKK
ncbi:DinB family protein [Arthrobacter sp. 2YAF22_2]|uniref:DinB family protein n=1 Tax=Arthrobacter sp. 2YAF22_2 TaxID=3233029 RepID=UPI003F8DE121